ncbi:MAG: segregation/condensation protein A [Gemmataceae bacterium]|nr:segregation/condensation protein A [Gemmataceae bacterium]
MAESAVTDPESGEYRVRLPEFHGPLDLLLHLVKRNEVDVRDIPVAIIAEQFRSFLDVIAVIDVEAAGEFLVTAATLLEIKSRLALPQSESVATKVEAEEDPRRELVQQLLEYKKFKDAASRLGGRAAEVGRRWPREPIAPPAARTELPAAVQSPELWDLVSAFGRLVQDSAQLEPDTVIADDTPQDVYREQVLAAVGSAATVAFRDAFPPPHHKLRLIGLFLAMLELIRNGRLIFTVGDTTDDIRLALVPVSDDRKEEIGSESQEVGG